MYTHAYICIYMRAHHLSERPILLYKTDIYTCAHMTSVSGPSFFIFSTHVTRLMYPILIGIVASVSSGSSSAATAREYCQTAHTTHHTTHPTHHGPDTHRHGPTSAPYLF